MIQDDSQVGKRIAVTNLDWDSISAVDLMALFQSFCHGKGTMSIERVQIYPSLYGLEQMKKDSLYGPPKEIFNSTSSNTLRKMKKSTEAKALIKTRKNKIERLHEELKEYMSDDEFELDEKAEGRNMARLRKYEVNKMKYFYGVIHCNSGKTANRIIEENQGMEFELTNIRLQLSSVPDEMEFPQKPKEDVTELPSSYSFDPTRVSRALNHSTVRLTWDQTDPKRAQRL